MKAIYLTETGGPDVLRYGDLPDPVPQANEVLVRVKAVALNPIDTYLRNGANYWQLPMPYVPGSDLAGEVVAVGDKVNGFRAGDRVWGSNQGFMGRQGVFSELAAVGEQWLYPIPSNVSYEAAAACALVGITAHLGLFQRGALRSGHVIFVRGGTGGVGSMVIQMARSVGAKVISTAGSDVKAQRCHELGAHLVIRHPTERMLESILEVAPNGVDFFWETLREPDFELAVNAMAEGGQMILMAGREARPTFPVGPFYVKGCSLHGFVMFKASPQEQQVAASDINHWLASGMLKPQIDRVMELKDAAEAHRLQEASTVQKDGSLAGKILLRVS